MEGQTGEAGYDYIEGIFTINEISHKRAMRTILFRGMTVQGNWKTGLPSNFHDTWYISNSAGSPLAYEVRTETIGQFTGLTDKDGNNIYEGDRFQIAGNSTYTVIFSEGCEANHEWYGGTFMLTNENATFPFDEYAMKTGVVIGNIHQS